MFTQSEVKVTELHLPSAQTLYVHYPQGFCVDGEGEPLHVPVLFFFAHFNFQSKAPELFVFLGGGFKKTKTKKQKHL